MQTALPSRNSSAIIFIANKCSLNVKSRKPGMTLLEGQKSMSRGACVSAGNVRQRCRKFGGAFDLTSLWCAYEGVNKYMIMMIIW